MKNPFEPIQDCGTTITLISFISDCCGLRGVEGTVTKELDDRGNPKTTYEVPGESKLVVTVNEVGHTCWDWVGNPGINIERLRERIQE